MVRSVVEAVKFAFDMCCFYVRSVSSCECCAFIVFGLQQIASASRAPCRRRKCERCLKLPRAARAWWLREISSAVSRSCAAFAASSGSSAAAACAVPRLVRANCSAVSEVACRQSKTGLRKAPQQCRMMRSTRTPSGPPEGYLGGM